MPPHVLHASFQDIWKTQGGNGDNKKQKKIPWKVLRYFPLTPRLQRLFMSSKTATDMRWHSENRVKDGELRHPADSEAWKHFDQIHESVMSLEIYDLD